MVVTISHEGYIKRNPVSLYRQQRRGGRGKMGTKNKGEDFVADMFVASTHSYLLFFTNRGRVYWKKVHQLPLAGRAARGKAIVNLLPLESGEKISAFLPVREFVEGNFVLFATSKGVVKKTPLAQYSRPRTSGIIAIKLDAADELISVRLTDGGQQVALSTRGGMLVRFEEKEVRSMGRSAAGVKGANLADGDSVVSMDVVQPGATLLTVSEKGYGKRSPTDDYRLVHRGAKGVSTMRCSDRTGFVVGVLQIVDGSEEVMIVSSGGKLIRLAASDIRVIGRNTQGVRLVHLSEEDESVVSVASVAEGEKEAAAIDGASDGETETDDNPADDPASESDTDDAGADDE
jgi:DNA gyrase subunit A